MTFEAYAREWLERQNFIKSTRKWTRQRCFGIRKTMTCMKEKRAEASTTILTSSTTTAVHRLTMNKESILNFTKDN